MRSRVFALVGVWCAAMAAVASHPRLFASQQAAPARPATAPAGPRTAPIQPIASRPAAAPASTVQPEALVQQYCVTCHNQRLKTGNLALDGAELSNIPSTAETWEKVTRKVRAGLMPPAGVPRPAPGRPDAPRRPPRVVDRHRRRRAPRRCVGRPSIASTDRSTPTPSATCFAVVVDVAAVLPPDEEAYGFDNNANVLGVSAVADGALPVGGLEGGRGGGGQPEDHAQSRDLPRPRRPVAARSRGGPADRHSRRHLHHALLPGRCRVRDQPAALSRDGEHHPRPGAAARARGHDRRPARAAGGASAARRTNRPTTCSRRSPATRWRSASRCACPSPPACTRSRWRSSRKAQRHHAGIAAAVRPRADRSDHAGRHPRTRAGDARRALQTGGEVGDSPSRRRIFICEPAAGQDAACAHEDPDHGGAPRLPRPARRRRDEASPRLLQRGAQERRQLRPTASRPRCASCWSARGSSSASSAIRPTWRRAPSTGSPIWSWHRGCRSSSGAASRTTSCWRRPSRAGSRTRSCSNSRCGGC